MLDHRRMNNSTSDILSFDLESVKKETEAGIYDDKSRESATPGTEQTRQASTEHEYASQRNMVVPRRMLFVIATFAAITLLTTIATLILTLTVMKPRNDSTVNVQGKKNCEYFSSY